MSRAAAPRYGAWRVAALHAGGQASRPAPRRGDPSRHARGAGSVPCWGGEYLWPAVAGVPRRGPTGARDAAPASARVLHRPPPPCGRACRTFPRSRVGRPQPRPSDGRPGRAARWPRSAAGTRSERARARPCPQAGGSLVSADCPRRSFRSPRGSRHAPPGLRLLRPSARGPGDAARSAVRNVMVCHHSVT